MDELCKFWVLPVGMAHQGTFKPRCVARHEPAKIVRSVRTFAPIGENVRIMNNAEFADLWGSAMKSSSMLGGV
jgi:hypothetical protein